MQARRPERRTHADDQDQDHGADLEPAGRAQVIDSSG
jgi:hypothetical protein